MHVLLEYVPCRFDACGIKRMLTQPRPIRTLSGFLLISMFHRLVGTSTAITTFAQEIKCFATIKLQ